MEGMKEVLDMKPHGVIAGGKNQKVNHTSSM